MKIMRFVVVYIFLITAFLFSACIDVNKDQIDLKYNSALRQEVFDQIINDRELMNKFLDQTKNEKESVRWMMEHSDFMNQLLHEKNMEYIMDNYTGMDMEMLQSMRKVLSKDSSLRRQWEMMYK